MTPGRVAIVQASALDLPLPDASVDLVVTSPPYFGLRSYTDGGEHYAGQIGSEATPTEFLDALIAATREMVRVLKPSGSIWVNLGDKYVSPGGHTDFGASSRLQGRPNIRKQGRPDRGTTGLGMPTKSLMLLPHRYAIRCVDELGLILRAEVIWSKPNGLPESVTDRVRRSHEQWFHFTVRPRYYSAVDAIREPVSGYHRAPAERATPGGQRPRAMADTVNPLGKLPGSVWTIPTQPLRVPAELGVDHFAAFPMEWPRRIISGWSPRHVCTACGEGRRPVVASQRTVDGVPVEGLGARRLGGYQSNAAGIGNWRFATERMLAGEVCGCPDTTAPTTPGVVLDPFGGTGTTALVASVLGRYAVTVDLSHDYGRVAQWRTTDSGQRARAAREKRTPKRRRLVAVPDAPAALFELPSGGAA